MTMTDEEIDELGLMLEDKGLSHSEIDVFFEHHGVKGMHWGIRKRERIQRTTEVGRGRSGFVRKARVYPLTNPFDLLRTGSFRKSAARKARRMTARNKRLSTKGKAKVRDYLIEAGTARVTDILPTLSKKNRTKDQRRHLNRMRAGKAFAIAVPAAALYLAPKVARQLSRA